MIETDIPAHLDALPFGRFHILVIVALGITWVLDGLEVTLAGALSGELMQKSALGLSGAQVGLAGSFYLAGAVLGAFGFGWLTDRLGRKKLFSITLAVYLVATAATGLAWNVVSYIGFRFLTGAGIGGEYTAINSTIQELIPARLRGWTDLIINGSFWIGAALGAGGSIVLLDPAFDRSRARLAARIPDRRHHRTCHSAHATLDTGKPALADHPRFRARGATRSCAGSKRIARPPVASAAAHGRARLVMRDHTPLGEVARTLFVTYRRRTLVGLALMAAQAFFYNAIFFTYALILTDFYGLPAGAVGWYILPFAAGNVLGPLALGRLFDTVGRRIMIASTYAISGVLLAGTGYLFARDLLSAPELTAAWMIVFFFASTAASSAYLTVSEVFPLEDSRARHRLLLCDRHGGRRHSRPAAARRLDFDRVARGRRRRLSDRRVPDDCRRAGPKRAGALRPKANRSKR